MAEKDKVAKKPPAKKRKRSEYGAGKLRAAREIQTCAEKLVELHAAVAQFPALKDVFEKETARYKARITSWLKRA